MDKRASMRAWLELGAIPDDQRLADDLTGVEFGYNADQEVQLEKKEHMKARGLPSPDDGDALACTFAAPVGERDFFADIPPATNRVIYVNGRYRDLGWEAWRDRELDEEGDDAGMDRYEW